MCQGMSSTVVSTLVCPHSAVTNALLSGAFTSKGVSLGSRFPMHFEVCVLFLSHGNSWLDIQ